MLGVVGQAGVIDPGHARVRLQKTRHAQGVAAVPLHAQGQGLDALQYLPGAHGAERCAKDAQAFHAAAHGESKVAKGLVKLDAVVARRRLCHTRKFPVVPGKTAAFNQHATQRGPVASQVLGGRMNDKVSTQRQRVAQEGAGHGVIDDQRHTVRVGHFGHGGNVEHLQAGVAQAFGKHGAGVRLHGGGKGFGPGGIDKGGLNAELGQADRQHGDRATIQRTGRHHVVTGLQNRHQRHGLRRHAGCGRHCSPPAFEGGDPLLKRRHCGIAQPRIHITKCLQVK